MEDYNSFTINNFKCTLTIENDESQYNENWLYSIDLSKIWNNYLSKSISIIDFNNEYASLLLEKKENIVSKISKSCWDEIEQIINELRSSTNESESESIYDKLYDIYDKFEIYVKIK